MRCATQRVEPLTRWETFRHNMPHPLRSSLLTILVFALLGPPVGAIVFVVAAVALGMPLSDAAGLGWVAVFAAFYAAPLSYVFGIIPALASGIAIALRARATGRVSWGFIIATGLIVGTGMALISGAPVAASGMLAKPGAISIILASLIATVVCAGLSGAGGRR